MSANPLIQPIMGVGPAPIAAGHDPSRPTGAVMDDARAMLVIDGTPMRVVVLSLAAAASIVALRWAGFRFNVGVSS